jgi:cysteinyl-tRNA synthetase
MKLVLSNTRSGEKAPFEPLNEGVVSMYHCGPTVTESININKFRAYLLGDLLRRYFEFHDLKVTQVMNITDVGHLNEFGEDALEVAAGRTGKMPEELAEEAIQAFHEDRKSLRILDAHEYPRAHDNVEEMVELVRKLESAGVIYESGNNVYFDVHKASGYGGLTGQSLAELADSAAPPEGDREVELRRHPLDIALWRTDILHDMHWQSPWGLGFPGWHLECVAMSRRFLGTTFDIHTGSEENIFPHHECEIALAEASEGKPLARYWLHAGHVLIDGETVSRANKNFLTVDGLRSTDVQGVEIRAALLGTHYRKRLDFHYDVIEEVRRQRKRLNDAVAKLEGAGAASGDAASQVGLQLDAAEKEFCDALDDDLDFPRALQAALSLADAINDGSCPVCAEAYDKLRRFDGVLALLG